MRYMTLAEMLDALKIEIRMSPHAAHNLDSKENHTYLLNRIQDELYLNYDWPALKTSEDVIIGPTVRYGAYPEGLRLESIEEVFAYDGDRGYFPIEYGIGPRHYNFKDPTDRADDSTPIKKWANYVPASGATNQNMFEVWPVPDVETKVLFKGTRHNALMTEDADKSTLDGPSIILHAAAEILAAKKSEDAALKLSKAQERVRTLKIRQRGGDNKIINLSGAGGSQPKLRRGIDYMEG